MTENLIDDRLNTNFNTMNHRNAYSFMTQLMTWFLLFITCYVVAQLISGSIIYYYYKTASLKTIATQVNNLNVLRIAQMLASLIGFGLPAYLFCKWKDISFLSYSRANVGFSYLLIIIVPLLLISFYPFINVTFFINKWIGFDTVSKSSQAEYKLLVNALLNDNSTFVLVLNVITIAVIPAIAEEWLFRGSFQRLLSEKLNIHLSVFLAAILFSIIHLEFSGFISRIALGMFLGYLFYYSGSLWTSIFAHAINNGAQVILMYLYNNGKYNTDVDKMEMPTVVQFIAYTIAFIALWLVFLRIVQKRKNSTFAE